MYICINKKLNDMILIRIFRELSKLVMFTLILGFPMYLSRITGNYGYLWLLILSLILMVGMFSHYEDLEKIDKLAELTKENDEQDTV